MTSVEPKRPIALGVWLIIAGAVGFFAAFALTLEKFAALAAEVAGTAHQASCDFNLVVTCTQNLNSPEGSLFGFPNPLIGIACWPVVVVVGVALLAGVRFPRWFWLTFNLGVVGALALVVFLIDVSIFRLGTLCIYCMITWLVTIPTFFAVTLRNASAYLRGGGQRFAAAAYGWVPVIALICFVAIAVIAQLRLDVLRYL